MLILNRRAVNSEYRQNFKANCPFSFTFFIVDFSTTGGQKLSTHQQVTVLFLDRFGHARKDA